MIGIYSYKKAGQPIINSNEHYVFEFDEEGRFISSYETHKNDGTNWKNWTIYVYSAKNELITIKKGRLSSLKCKEFKYNDQGICVEEKTYIENQTTKNQIRKFIFTDKISVQRNHKVQIRTYNNSFGLPYLTETIKFDTNGYLLEKTEQFLVSLQTVTTKFTYTEKGFISSIQKINSDDPTALEEQKFEYDESGNMTEKKSYKNGVYLTEMNFLYNSKTFFLVNVLLQDVASNSITLFMFV
jgi:YD repeat-containing protein